MANVVATEEVLVWQTGVGISVSSAIVDRLSASNHQLKRTEDDWVEKCITPSWKQTEDNWAHLYSLIDQLVF
jgi:hypothetical protein